MSGQKPVLLFELFPFCAGSDKLTADYSGALVVSATIDKTKLAMKLTVSLTEPAPPLEISAIEELITREYGLSSATISAVYARTVPSEKSDQPDVAAGSTRAKNSGSVILGRQTKSPITPMSEIALELGKVTVCGEVCDISHKELEKSGAWVLSFDLTDYTGTIHVSKYTKDENAAKTIKKIKKGMCLTVSGNLSISRFDDDIVLDPVNIVTREKEIRLDTAKEKRVELHLHTKMSALDAVTDTSEAIKRAVEWGHPAIAITDHGVVNSFPEAAGSAYVADGRIKVIYGVEAYFINDVKSSTAVFGSTDAMDGEYVIFDIETTGLSPVTDSLFEIGAVIVRNGQELGRFHTFADPGKPIPYEITDLTGKNDADVAGAPSQKDAVSAFLQFVGNRTLVAHNAIFDVGFIYEACKKNGIPFDPRYIDTLALARGFLPHLKNHRLNTVSAHLGYSSFKHHSADEDAAAAAYIWTAFLKLLDKAGVNNVCDINDYLLKRFDNKLSGYRGKRGRSRIRHIVILVKNQTGLNNLYKLITKSHLEYFDRYPIIPKSVLEQHRDGLIIGSACEAGEVFDAITERCSGLELRMVADFYDYLEIQPICNNTFMIFGNRPRAKNEDELRAFNCRTVSLGAELGKPVVATGDVHFLDPGHEIFRHILLTSKGYENADDDLPIYFKTTDEMLEEFKYLGEETAYDVVVRNPRMISDMCETVNPLPPQKTLFAPKLEGSAETLKELVYSKLRDLYGENPPELVKKRVETELRDILDRNYDVIYIAAQMLVSNSIKHGYLVGSRGSVGSSIVAYLAGITEVNALPAHYRCPNCHNSCFESGIGWGCGADMPDSSCPVCGERRLKDGFNIPFETFLGFDGDKVPDIDLNFSGEYQAQAHKHTIKLFGADHVFRAGTIGRIADKTAYGFVKKYLETIGKTVTKAEENRLVRGCIGVKRTTGQHPGGMIVIPKGMAITDFCPAQHPADDSDKGIITTHFDYECLEDNLIKLDALAHDDPTMIKMLEDLTGIDAREIKFDDPDTMAIFTSPKLLGLPENDEIIGATGSIGIPEFGTPLTRQMLCDTKPRNFDTLVRLSGFSHGTDVWLGNAKDLIMSGKATVSDTISCRDDIMLYLISKGMDDRYAFRISESVRKGSKLPNDAEREMIRFGVPNWYIESCKKIKYLFPKAHAVAYVMMAFRIAWFKVHKPLAFYSAYFYRRSQKDSFDAEYMTRGIDVIRARINEIRNNPDSKAKDEEMLITLEACYEFYLRGYEFIGVDIYESDPVKFLTEGEKKLRTPFVAISGLGETVASDIAEKRIGRKFISIDDISTTCQKVTKAHLEQLKTLGALRNLPQSSQMSLF